MKRLSLFFTSVFILLNISIYGQDIYVGKIFEHGIPQFSPDYPLLPCSMLWLETTSGNYILSDGSWIICRGLIVDGIEYEIDDEVEITGTVKSSGIDIYSVEHFTLEIETIKKLTSTSIESVSFRNNKVYYDEIKQVIVIDETLQNQSSTFELMNMQGEVILKKAGIDNNGSISVENLLSGVYLYRLFLHNNGIYFGKIFIF